MSSLFSPFILALVAPPFNILPDKTCPHPRSRQEIKVPPSLIDKISRINVYFMRLTSRENETSNLDASIAEGAARIETTEHSNASDIFSLQNSAHDRTSRQHHGDQCVSRDIDDEEFSVSLPQEEEKPQRPSILPRPSSIARHASFLDHDEAPLTSPSPTPPKNEAGPVAWRDLPNKSQLAILTLARLSEPLTQTSLQAYMFYQLRSFDPSLPTSSISAQAGMMQGSFTAAQFLTAILWGRLADTERVGRKRVLLIGLAGTGFSCLGFGFSRTFWQAMVCRTLGGALNGNVGVMRTMISEIIKEKRFQSRAFLLLPMCFNIGKFGQTTVHRFADGGHRRHYRTSLGWIAFGPCKDLSQTFWEQFVFWWGQWSLLAEALALCSSKFNECGFPIHLCYGCHFRAQRGMLKTTNIQQLKTDNRCRRTKPYEIDQIWASALVAPSLVLSVTFSAATLTTTALSMLKTTWPPQEAAPGSTPTNSNPASSPNRPSRSRSQDGNYLCPGSGPETSSAPSSATRS